MGRQPRRPTKTMASRSIGASFTAHSSSRHWLVSSNIKTSYRSMVFEAAAYVEPNVQCGDADPGSSDVGAEQEQPERPRGKPGVFQAKRGGRSADHKR